MTYALHHPPYPLPTLEKPRDDAHIHHRKRHSSPLTVGISRYSLDIVS